MFCALFLKYTLYFQHICITGTSVSVHLSLYTRALWTPFAPEADVPDVEGEGSGTGKGLRCFGLLLPFPTAPSGSNTSCWQMHQDATYYYGSNVHNLVRCIHRKLTDPNSVWLHSPRGIIITLVMKIFHWYWICGLVDILNAADGLLTCVGHRAALLGTIFRRIETFLTMVAFHGIPSSNLLDADKASPGRGCTICSVQLPEVPQVWFDVLSVAHCALDAGCMVLIVCPARH